MKEFEKWFTNWKKEDLEHRDNFWYVLMKPFMKVAWRAALEWVKKELMIGYENAAPGDSGWLGKFIEDELEEE